MVFSLIARGATGCQFLEYNMVLNEGPVAQDSPAKLLCLIEGVVTVGKGLENEGEVEEAQLFAQQRGTGDVIFNPHLRVAEKGRRKGD